MIDRGLAFEYELLIVLGLLLVLAIVNGLHAYGYLGIRIKFLSRLKEKIQNKLPKKNREVSFEFKREENNHEVIENKLKKVLSKLKTFGKIVWNYKLLLLNLLIVPIIVFLFNDMLSSPGKIWNYPGTEEELRSYEEPLVIEFDRPIYAEDVQPYIFPEIDGEWKMESAISWMPWSKRQLKFYPKETMFPGKLFIYYAGITDVFERTERWEYGIDAYSVRIPEIVSIYPDDGTTDFAVDGSVEVEIDVSAGKAIEWELEVTPTTEYQVEYVDGKNIKVTFSENLHQGELYNFKLFRVPVRYNIESEEVIERGESELVKEISFTTVKEPLVSEFSPKNGGVLTDTNVRIIFDNEMDQAQVQDNFSITPSVSGAMSWEDPKTFVFNPDQNLAKETTYKVNFPAGLRSTVGGYTEKEVAWEFTTIGAVTVSSFAPAGNSASKGSNINITFNQAVDKASAQSHVSITPTLQGTYSWSGTTLVFNPSQDMPFNTTYTVSVSPGVKTIYGLDSRSAFSHSFTTEPEVFILNVPIIYQQLRYSCNLVSTRMALAYRGIYVSTLTLHSQIAKDNTPWDPDNNIWGNPNVGYLGDIYGVNKGYGVYWGPISGLISGYRSSSAKTGWNRTAALQEVKNGNPVIIWAHNGYSYAGKNISWHTPGGDYIYAVSGMHSYVIVGYEGPIENPTYIYLNDPNRGRWKITTSYFNSLWGFFNNSAVVVY